MDRVAGTFCSGWSCPSGMVSDILALCLFWKVVGCLFFKSCFHFVTLGNSMPFIYSTAPLAHIYFSERYHTFGTFIFSCLSFHYNFIFFAHFFALDTAIPSSSHRIPFRIAKLSLMGRFSTGVGDHLGSSRCCIAFFYFLVFAAFFYFLVFFLGTTCFVY